MVRRVPSKHRNNPVAREIDRAAVIRLALLLVCGLAITGGFLQAGRQHFAALRYGYETENLRKVNERLAEEQRRYLLEREAALNPARLERAARELGMQPIQPAQIDPLVKPQAAETKTPAVNEAPSRPRPRETKASSTRTAKGERANSKPI